MKRAILFFALLFAAGFCRAQPVPGPLLLQEPTLSRTQIVFVCAGELWSVPRPGGEATRLTIGPSQKAHPEFSPDGNRKSEIRNFISA